MSREGASGSYPVGDSGEVFIPDLEYGARYVARWNGSRCTFAVEAPRDKAGVMPRYGPVRCDAAAP